MTLINESLVYRLVTNQFPQWKDLPIRPVEHQGWDNRTFRLGEHMLVRLPSSEEYSSQVQKEHKWLPKLAPGLPLSIPVPFAIGEPDHGYPWQWSINRWLEGSQAATAQIKDLCAFASTLAQFLTSLQRIDASDGPLAGPHSFYRGGSLATYDTETRQALTLLKDKIDVKTATEVWETALASTWQNPPVWVHGDISPGNLLVQNGQLSAVIDFGQLAVGDPACDLAIAWTFLKGRSREIFRDALLLDTDTWARGRGWALWKALIVAAGLTSWNAVGAAQALNTISEVLADHRRENTQETSMFNKIDIQEEAIINCLRKDYALPIQEITLLPLGADRNTTVFRANTEDGLAYFVKLRREEFNEMSLIVPKMLYDHGIPHIIAPLGTHDGSVSRQVNGFYLSVYHFIAGQDGHDAGLTNAHWIKLGQTLKGIHTAILPPEVAARIPKESFSGRWRERVKQFQQQIDKTTFDDQVSAKLADLLKRQRAVVDTLIRRSEYLASVLQTNLPPFVLCHGDIHAWNILIQTDGTFYVVDWDTVILAPKEHDLMFIASGLFGKARTPEEEETLFYQGYGDQKQADPIGLAYYRYERIVRDIAEYCEEIFLAESGSKNREQGFKQLSLQFEPGQVIDLALRSEQFLPPSLQSL